MTHGALAGILLKNYRVGLGPWESGLRPVPQDRQGDLNYISENVTAIKNFSEYLMPAEIDSRDELKPGQGGIMRDGLKKIASAAATTAASRLLGRVHASGLPRALELDRAMLGLSLPWFAVRARRRGAQRAGPVARWRSGDTSRRKCRAG